jgi:uncharacterized protein (UPF0264 family)
VNEKEATEAIAGGADIIDVKNPQEGALGANFPWVIKRIREIAPKHIQVSCAVGEVPNLPGSISLAALGAASLGVDYIKVGLRGLRTPQEVSYLLKNVNKAAKECNPKIKVVAVGYADADRIDSINPLLIPEIAFKTEVDVAMIDTAIKDDKNIFTFLTVKQLEKFVDSAHDLGLEAALAGSLKKQDLLIVYSLDADVAGLRGAACTNNDRVKGQITRNLVHEIAEVIKQAETNVNIKKV